jgi:6-phosphofructokinase 1
MRKIGVLTSGGDAPGMNAAIRGVVRTAIAEGLEVTGFLYGYKGLIADEAVEMTSRSVGGIVSLGGTILRSARCKEFREPQGRRQAMETLARHRVDGLVVIGGDGSLTGAMTLFEEFGLRVMGVPGSIDNDLGGTDFSVGFDTAVNTALEAIDRIRDTAYSHERVFVVEVMGRHNGFIALDVAIAGGAEAVLIPERTYSLGRICEGLRAGAAKGKRSSIIVVAEGAARAQDVRDFIVNCTGFDARFSVLGHIQRGGGPTAFDRVLALRLGNFAVHKLLSGTSGEMVGVEGERLVSNPIPFVLQSVKPIDEGKLAIIEAMDR